MVMDGAMLEAAVTFTVLVGEAATLPELSRASATTSAGPGGTPANGAVSRHVFASWSRVASPMLLRLRKNSTPTTEPSESVALAVKFTVDAVVVDAGTFRVTLGASPWRFVTTTRRETVLVPVAVVPMLACVETMNVSGVVGVQIAR